MTLDTQKRAASLAAVAEVRAGMLIGLGTGSTAAYAIAAISGLVREGLAVRAVATSLATAALARAAGIEVLDFADLAAVDLCIDGVDEIDPAGRALKGAGGALLREKIVATAATRMIAIADSSKLVDRLGGRPLVVEVLPFAVGWVRHRIAGLRGVATLRTDAGERPARTDQDNMLLDCDFGPIDDPAWLAGSLSSIPGVLGHGLFVSEINAVYVGDATGVECRERGLPRQAEDRAS